MLIVVYKCDYNPISSKLIIRIITTLRDTFIAKLVTKIKEEFKNLKKELSRDAAIY
jgi:hypothetical protein